MTSAEQIPEAHREYGKSKERERQLDSKLLEQTCT